MSSSRRFVDHPKFVREQTSGDVVLPTSLGYPELVCPKDVFVRRLLGRPARTLQPRLVGGPEDVSGRRSGDDLTNITKSSANRRLGKLYSRRLRDPPVLVIPKDVFTCRCYDDLSLLFSRRLSATNVLMEVTIATITYTRIFIGYHRIYRYVAYVIFRQSEAFI